MKTQHSFSFQVRRFVPPEMEQFNSISANLTGAWVMSAGRWDTHLEAVQAADKWLEKQAETEPQQYELQIVQVEELELIDCA